MPNPYASTAGAATITAAVAGNERLNELKGPSGPDRDPVSGARMSAAQVTRRLLAYVRPHRMTLVAAFASSAASVVLQLYTPILIGRGIDMILGAGRVDFVALAPLLIELATVVVAGALLQWLQGVCVNRVSYVTVRDLRVEANDKLTRVPLSLVDSHAHGDLISRVVNDVDQVGDGLLQGLNQLFNGVVTVLATLVFMLATSLPMALVVVLATPFSMLAASAMARLSGKSFTAQMRIQGGLSAYIEEYVVPMALVVVLATPFSMLAASAMARLSGKSFTAQMRIQGGLSAYIEEYVGAQRLVSAFAYGDRACEGFSAINSELYTTGERAQFLSSLSNPGTRFVNNIIYAAVAVAGFVGVITGFPAPLTVGEVQIFLSYANQYTKPFNEISAVVTQIQGAYASARRVFTLLDAVEDVPDAEDAVELDVHAAGPAVAAGDVVFDHVDFSYVKEHPCLGAPCLHAARCR